MTVSMRVMSAGDGYKYLLKTVAAADGNRPLSTPLTRYYMKEGTPPGRWLGAGVAALGKGEIQVGDRVSEHQLQLLMGTGHDPITDEPLGRAFPTYKSQDERIEARIANLDPTMTPGAKGEAVAQIVAEETARSTRRAVAGFDFTFSIPKSASVLWAVADAGVQALIAEAHHRAVAEVVAFTEREVAATRTGATAGDGAVAQVDVTGLIATAFDHFDSRAGDPHLHTHVVISNKAKTVLDGKWRSLDGRPMHAVVVALSELHEAVFADHMTRIFGVSWEAREMGRDRNPAWAITGVPEELVAEFSTRARHIDAEKNRLIDEYVAQHGRQPSNATILKLRAQATLATRPEKQVRSLADLTAEWRTRASKTLGQDATSWARAMTDNDKPLLLRADDVPLDVWRDCKRIQKEAMAKKEHVDDMIGTVQEELVALTTGVTEEDLASAKAMLKYNMMMQMDGTSPNAEEIGRQMLTFGRRMSLAETFARIDAIEPADVQRVAEAIIWDQEIAFAAVGPGLKYVGDMNYLRRGTFWNRL